MSSSTRRARMWVDTWFVVQCAHTPTPPYVHTHTNPTHPPHPSRASAASAPIAIGARGPAAAPLRSALPPFQSPVAARGLPHQKPAIRTPLRHQRKLRVPSGTDWHMHCKASAVVSIAPPRWCTTTRPQPFASRGHPMFWRGANQGNTSQLRTQCDHTLFLKG